MAAHRATLMRVGASIDSILMAGFGQVVAAVHGIPGAAMYFGSAAQTGRGTGAGGRVSISKGAVAASGPVGIEKNRHAGVMVSVATSWRDVTTASAVHNRWGPTAAQSGSQ